MGGGTVVNRKPLWKNGSLGQYSSTEWWSRDGPLFDDSILLSVELATTERVTCDTIYKAGNIATSPRIHFKENGCKSNRTLLPDNTIKATKHLEIKAFILIVSLLQEHIMN